MYNPETKQWEGYIYKIYNSYNNYLYIGQTKTTIEDRFSKHVFDARKGSKQVIHIAMRTIGIENFYVDIVETVLGDSKKQLSKKLDNRERYYIGHLNTLQPGGYNVSPGRGSKKCSKVYHYSLYDHELLNVFSSVANASKHTGIPEPTIRDCCNGNSKSTRCGVFVYEKDLGRDMPSGYSVNVYMHLYSLDGKYIKSYHSVREASEDLFLTYTQVWTRLKNHSITCGQYVLLRDGDNFDLNHVREEILPHYKSTPIDEYDENGNLIASYKTIKDAAIGSGYNRCTIRERCLNPEIKSYPRKKHLFRFHNQ